MLKCIIKHRLAVSILFLGALVILIGIHSALDLQPTYTHVSQELAAPDEKPPATIGIGQVLPQLNPQLTSTIKPHFSYNPQPNLLWTFDDCEDHPGQGVVASYINFLKKHQIARAIFFMTGDCYYSRPDLVRLIQTNGYVIGNHTKDHADLTKLTVSQIDAEIKGGPPHTKYFRPPYGSHNNLVDERVKIAGMTMLIWGASGGDSGIEGKTRSCDRILEDLVHTTDPGDAVLLHMHNPNSPLAMNAYLSGKPNCED